MKLNIAAIDKNDLCGNTLEVNLAYSAFLLAWARKKAIWGNVSAILHIPFVFAGGLGWLIYLAAVEPGNITDVPRFVWLSIVILPLIAFLLDVIFAIFAAIQKSVLARNCAEFGSDGDLSASLNCLEQNLTKAYTTHASCSIVTVGIVGFTGAGILFFLGALVTESQSSPETKITWVTLLGVCIFGLIAYLYSAIFLAFGNWWFERVFCIEKEEKKIGGLHSLYRAYAEQLRFEAMTPEEQQRYLEEKKKREEEPRPWTPSGKYIDGAYYLSQTNPTSPSYFDGTSPTLTSRDHDDLDMLQNMSESNFADGM